MTEEKYIGMVGKDIDVVLNKSGHIELRQNRYTIIDTVTINVPDAAYLAVLLDEAIGLAKQGGVKLGGME